MPVKPSRRCPQARTSPQPQFCPTTRPKMSRPAPSGPWRSTPTCCSRLKSRVPSPNLCGRPGVFSPRRPSLFNQASLTGDKLPMSLASHSDRQHTTTAHVRIHPLSHGDNLPEQEIASRQLRPSPDSPASAARASLRRRRSIRSLRIIGQTLRIHTILLI